MEPNEIFLIPGSKPRYFAGYNPSVNDPKELTEEDYPSIAREIIEKVEKRTSKTNTVDLMEMIVSVTGKKEVCRGLFLALCESLAKYIEKPGACDNDSSEDEQESCGYNRRESSGSAILADCHRRRSSCPIIHRRFIKKIEALPRSSSLCKRPWGPSLREQRSHRPSFNKLPNLNDSSQFQQHLFVSQTVLRFPPSTTVG